MSKINTSFSYRFCIACKNPSYRDHHSFFIQSVTNPGHSKSKEVVQEIMESENFRNKIQIANLLHDCDGSETFSFMTRMYFPCCFRGRITRAQRQIYK
jgi:hypothetical protein